jgi:23S rRNA (cytidine1920-2'-O)/16S rRNA (cytidine1409-2'-O)-methyltransferase
MAKTAKERIDKLLVEKGLVADIAEAQKFLLAGLVVVDDHRVDKAGTLVKKESAVRIKNHIPYVSRGGLKLQKAVSAFFMDFSGKVVIDIGASTGGFTDVALINGAAKVFSVDIGKGQLDPKLARDERVKVLDGVNFRSITFDVIGAKADIIIGDVSFISLSKILPACVQFSESTDCVFLIKPQFEAVPGEVEKGGIVNDKTVHERVIIETAACAAENGYTLHGLTKSPIKGAKGNIEYLACFVYNAHSEVPDIKQTVYRVVHEEYCYYRQASR